MPSRGKLGKLEFNALNETEGAECLENLRERDTLSIHIVGRSRTVSKEQIDRPGLVRISRYRIGIHINSVTTRRLGSVGNSAWT
jgi:hypothetical protein